MIFLAILPFFCVSVERFHLIGAIRFIGIGENSNFKAIEWNSKNENRQFFDSLKSDQIEAIVSDETQSVETAKNAIKSIFPFEVEKANIKVLSGAADVLFNPQRACPRLANNRFNAAEYALSAAEERLSRALAPWKSGSVAELIAEKHELAAANDRLSAAALRASIALNIHSRFGENRGMNVAASKRGLTSLTSFSLFDALRYEAFGVVDLVLRRVERLVEGKSAAPRLTVVVGAAAKLFEVLALFQMSSAECIAADPTAERPLCRFFPSPGAALDFEVLRRGRDAFVRVSYNGEAISMCPSESVICPFAEFDTSLDETLKSDFFHFCRTGQKLLINPGRRAKRTIARIIFAVGAVLLLIGLKRRWPELTLARPSWQISDRKLENGDAPKRE